MLKKIALMVLVGLPVTAYAAPGEVRCPPYIGSAETAEYAKARGNYKCFATARAAKKFGFLKQGSDGGSSGASAPSPINGNGNYSTGVFYISGPTQVNFSYSGQRNFIVTLYNSDGSYGDLLANEIGSISGSTSINKKGTYFMNIESSGTWSITFTRK